ncbi:LLM class flavin-dependent oxidoreductase [Pseudomonas argentinensis]|uniref:FMN-dependent oxidoreductase, nitrilotriacetate monooxygenase family n=1 Tax=Phytopseudomonas argentinensis TaxID=289370 RepID=A0A1I3NJI5_9GAMM|nr:MULTISPECIES: LLM class flavin-dependent oxidoreductase [Pseudomonas]KAB0549934.1 LLM class flavin-dependent oxidoreductase [Pseudomonas argentinensis]CAH0272858.1 Nitrilotriacetate monooxygenase component A [Pseudomonas sp. Bi70]SFJ09441.1 FMN-dependent oxidoreductase, nitrilotriacetate monooxygenase family [Pseudomonas argentinensis]
MSVQPASPRQLRLGLFVQALGHHVGGWRAEGAKGSPTDIDWFTWIARKAEEGKFDMFFVGDALATSVHRLPSTMSRLEPLTLLSALAVQTKHIGLAATASTTFDEPFHLARALCSVDHISRGRGAWNVVTSFSLDAARNFSREDLPSHADRYEMAREFLDVAFKLWDGWEEGAIVREKDTGRYSDESKIHPANHKGKHFQVQGPLNIARSPQGRPVIIEAGSSPAGQQLAAQTAEVVFTAASSLEEGQAFYQSQKQFVRDAGRQPDHLLILPGVMPIVGRTREEAQAVWNQLNELVDIDNGIEQLSARFGVDMTAYPLDGPVPEIPATEGSQSRVKLLTELAARENLTLRQLAAVAAGSRGHRVVVGTAEDIADDFQHWLEQGGADGFNIMPAVLPDQLELFVELVIPELQRRGLFRTDYQYSTLRENLGLPSVDENFAAVAPLATEKE